MKTFNIFLVFIYITILFSFGCSEKSQLPNQPIVGESANSLAKAAITNFTATEIPIQLINSGTMKIVGPNMVAKGMIIESNFESGNYLINGTITVTGNGNLSINTGEGPVHGKFTLTPDAVSGGVWEGNWTGYRKISGNMEWTTNAHLVAHGVGGDIEGMMFYADEAIISNDPSGGLYTGEANGYIKSK
jgi:hypothetical protein